MKLTRGEIVEILLLLIVIGATIYLLNLGFSTTSSYINSTNYTNIQTLNQCKNNTCINSPINLIVLVIVMIIILIIMWILLNSKNCNVKR